MKKRSWLLFILIALLWWLNFYAKRRNTEIKLLPQTGIPRPSLEEIEAKEKALKEQLIEKARKIFRESKGREVRDMDELIEEGLLRPDIF